jgi:hypothetical protein
MPATVVPAGSTVRPSTLTALVRSALTASSTLLVSDATAVFKLNCSVVPDGIVTSRNFAAAGLAAVRGWTAVAGAGVVRVVVVVTVVPSATGASATSSEAEVPHPATMADAARVATNRFFILSFGWGRVCRLTTASRLTTPELRGNPLIGSPRPWRWPAPETV